MRALALGLACAVGCGGKSSTEPEKKPVAERPADPNAIPGVDLPEVDGPGYAPAATKVPLLRVTPRAIFVEGLEVVKLVDGKVGAKDPEELGLKIPKLTEMLTTLGGKNAAQRPPLVLALDRTMTYGTMIEVMFSAKQPGAGWKSFSFLATSGGKLVAVPLTLPDKAASGRATVGRGPGASGGRISVTPPVSSSIRPDLTADQVLTKIHGAYLGGANRCYKSALTRDPSLRGKINLSFDVNVSGRLINGKAKGFDANVDRCIEGMMSAWIFPVPSAESSFSVALQFVPDDDATTAAPRRPPPAGKPSMGDEVRRLAEIPTGADDPDEERRRALRDNPLYVDLDDDQPPLNMVVSVHDGKILLWSLTQREGTRDKPKLELPADDAASIGKVRDALLEIVKRNYAGKKRTPATKSAILMADERTPIALVAKLFGAMRGGTGDAEAFPDIQLSSSIR